MPQSETANLWFKDIRSDKTYSLSLSQCETGWTVMATFGRRGSTQQADTKVERADYDAAKKIYDRVLHEKLTKGYRYVEQPSDRKPVQSTAPTVYTPESKEVVHDTELLTRISESELKNYLKNDRYLFQIKRDGRRLALKFDHGHVSGFNKLGQVVQVDPHLRVSVATLCNKRSIQTMLLDGEWEASGYHVWDLLELDSDMRGLPYEDRFDMLAETVVGAKLIHLVDTAESTAEKGALYLRAKQKRAEGICVKLKSAPYRGGRNGSHLKFKFESTASVIVGPKLKQDAHRSVGMWLYDKGRKRHVGNVKVADRYPVPPENSVIEIRYLYLHSTGGSLAQPVYFGRVRTDVRAEECTVQQLRLKQDAA